MNPFFVGGTPDFSRRGLGLSRQMSLDAEEEGRWERVSLGFKIPWGSCSTFLWKISEGHL